MTEQIYQDLAELIYRGVNGRVCLKDDDGNRFAFRVSSDVTERTGYTGVELNGVRETYPVNVINQYSCKPVDETTDFDEKALRQAVDAYMMEQDPLGLGTVGPDDCIFSNGVDYIKLSI